MKKFALCLILASLLVVPVVASAVATNNVPEDADIVLTTLNKIVNLLFTVLLVAADVSIAYSAFLFLTSSGDPEKAGSARQIILYALIALVVAFLAKGIVALVNSILFT